MARTNRSSDTAHAWSTLPHAPPPDEVLAVARTSNSYRELFDAHTDCVVEYHAIRRGYEIVSHINYTLLRRVRRRRDTAGSATAG